MAKAINSNIKVFHPWGNRYSNAEVKLLVSGFHFAEGPVWHPGGYLLFSDTPANKIYRVSMDGRFGVYLENSGLHHNELEQLSDQVGSNGLALTDDNHLLICQHGDHAVSLLNDKKELLILANSFQGSTLNSPNDIVVRSDGIIYFTDPPYGLKDQVITPQHFQPLAGLYRYQKGELTLAATGLKYPNGLAFSPGEEFLYVSSTHPEDKKLLKYRSLPDGSLVLIETVTEECADGITTDKRGSLFLSTEKGILIVSPGGEKLALLPLPEWPSNMAWVDNDDGILLVTARSSIYQICFR